MKQIVESVKVEFMDSDGSFSSIVYDYTTPVNISAPADAEEFTIPDLNDL